MVAGREASPKDARAVERLKEYWTKDPKHLINWGVPGDFNRCVTALSRYMKNPDMVKGYCAEIHKRATGARPGHAPGAEQAMYEAKHRKGK